MDGNRWIPIDEALPINSDDVMISVVNEDGYKDIEIGYYSTAYGEWNFYNAYFSEPQAEAWMPIPEPYLSANV